jgi:uncharacterized protein (DUF342 family)
MPASDTDGFFDLELNRDETQVFLTAHPPRGAGRCASTEDVIGRLRQMGILSGIREGEISRLLAQVVSANAPVARQIVAQGVLPTDPVDAQIQWVIDGDAASRPLPVGDAQSPDYFSVPDVRVVESGQLLATVKPGKPGSPGKTITAPFRMIPVAAPREIPYGAGNFVRYVAETQQYVSTTAGIVEVRDDQIFVHPFEWVEGNLNNVQREFESGVVILGDVTACTIHASGPVAIRGTVAGCMIRSKGDVVVSRCARTTIVADGDVFVLGKLLHSQVITPKRFSSAHDSIVMGGTISATLGVLAFDLGSTDGTEMLVSVALDRFSPVRQREVEMEIARFDDNVQKIARALRPLLGAKQDAVPEHKRELVQTLVAQRRRLEDRVRELHHEKRNLLLASKSRVEAEVSVAGTIYRGVTVQLDGASSTIGDTMRAVRFSLDPFREAVLAEPIERARAA